MSSEQRMVTEFHRAFDIAIETTPAIPDLATCSLRVTLIQEEFDELRAALSQRDIEAVAKELADLLYVVYGTAVSCGIDMAPVFREVHRSNMSKVGGHKRADGKWLKPPDYSPARLQPILAAQSRGEPCSAPEHLPQAASDPVVDSSSLQVSTRALDPVAPLPISEDGRQVRRRRRRGSRRHESLAIQCPRCGKSFVRRSHRKGLKERLLSLVYIYPFRCQVCANRFSAFRFRIRYAKYRVDRRQHVRLMTQLPTTFVEAITPGEHRVGQGVVNDLSLGGCRLQTIVQLREGALLSLELHTTARTAAIVVEAAIVRGVQPTGVNLEFLRLSEPEHERLSLFLRQLLVEQLAQDGETESG